MTRSNFKSKSRQCLTFVTGVVLTKILLQSALAQEAPQLPRFGMQDSSIILVGTSRIGNRASAALQLSDGRQVRVASKKGEAVSIDALGGFSITEIESKRVLIQQSNQPSCLNNPEGHTQCADAKASFLHLQVRPYSPTETAPAALANATSANDLSGVKASAGSFINQLQNKAEALGVRAEIPEGMELIETSAGIQLIPED